MYGTMIHSEYVPSRAAIIIIIKSYDDGFLTIAMTIKCQKIVKNVCFNL